jgi:hypothetical protein
LEANGKAIVKAIAVDLYRIVTGWVEDYLRGSTKLQIETFVAVMERGQFGLCPQ